MEGGGARPVVWACDKDARARRRPAREPALAENCLCARARGAPSAMAVLPTPGSPSRIGLFLERRARIWMTRATSLSRPVTCGARVRPRCAVAVMRRLGRAAVQHTRAAGRQTLRVRPDAKRSHRRASTCPHGQHSPACAAPRQPARGLLELRRLMCPRASIHVRSSRRTGSMRPFRASSHRSRQNSASALLPFIDDPPPLLLCAGARRGAQPGGPHQKKRARRFHRAGRAGRASVTGRVRLGGAQGVRCLKTRQRGTQDTQAAVGTTAVRGRTNASSVLPRLRARTLAHE
jgi:hypothetical protein